MQIPKINISQDFASENQLAKHESPLKSTATSRELQSEHKKTERQLSPLLKTKSKSYISGLSAVIKMVESNPDMKKMGNMTTLSEMLSETPGWPPKSRTRQD
jgi:hypothetical protein